jgi:hypothetical protein
MMVSRTTRGLWAVALVACLGLAAEARAATITAFTDRTSLGGNDLIDWGSKGPNLTLLSNPFAVTSTGGLGANVSKTLAGNFQVRIQSTSWAGNFSPGENLLWTNTSSTTPQSIVIEFATAVMGAGANIQSDAYGTYLGLLEAFDSGGNSLGSQLLSGTASSNANGTALFMGLKSTEANIKSIAFRVTSAPSVVGSFAINQVSLVTANPVPEPATIASAAMAGLMLLAARRFRARKTA